MLAQEVMARTSQAITCNPAINKCFVVGFARRRQSNDREVWTDASVINDLRSIHHSDSAGIYCYRAGEVSDICGLPAATRDVQALVPQEL